MKIEVITHYQEDTEDYYDVEILIDDKVVASYGDYYHDKGEEKVEGFLDAVKYFVPTLKSKDIINTRKIDR